MAGDTGLWLWMFGVLTGPWVQHSLAHEGDSKWHVWRSLVIVAYWFSPSNPTPEEHNFGRAGVSTRPSTLLNGIEKLVFVISYCSLIEASKIMRNKSRVILPALVTVGGNWVILQITPAGTFPDCTSVWGNKNNSGQSRVEIIPVLSNNPITPQPHNRPRETLGWG